MPQRQAKASHVRLGDAARGKANVGSLAIHVCAEQQKKKNQQPQPSHLSLPRTMLFLPGAMQGVGCCES